MNCQLQEVMSAGVVAKVVLDLLIPIPSPQSSGQLRDVVTLGVLAKVVHFLAIPIPRG